MGDDHVYRGVAAVVPVALVEDLVLAVVAPRDDDVRVLALGLDVLVVRRLHEALVLHEDALHRPPARAHVAEDAAGQPGVRVRLDEDAEVDEVAVRVAPVAEEREDALEQHHVQVPQLAGHASAAVRGVVVLGDVRHLAPVEVLERRVDELPVERGGGVEVKVLGVQHLLGGQAPVEAVLGHDAHLGVGKLGLDEVAHRGLPGGRGTGDPDDKGGGSVHGLGLMGSVEHSVFFLFIIYLSIYLSACTYSIL